jgi:hypothetical protein
MPRSRVKAVKATELVVTIEKNRHRSNVHLNVIDANIAPHPAKYATAMTRKIAV